MIDPYAPKHRDPNMSDIGTLAREIAENTRIPLPNHVYPPEPAQLTTREWIAKLILELTWSEHEEMCAEIELCNENALPMSKLLNKWAKQVRHSDSQTKLSLTGGKDGTD